MALERIKCFMVEPTGKVFHYRWSATDWDKKAEGTCPIHGDRHMAREDCSKSEWEGKLGPETCDCGYRFTDAERREGGGTERECRRLDTGEILPRNTRWPVGAMWFAEWLEEYPQFWKGPDGRILVVMTPGGEWNIDSRAPNCTMKDDDKHRCWVRHGKPPEITVDKNGLTCRAGAGSIQCGDYHGFLRGGYLERA